jgi:iron complex transport system substrate-binding protein
MVGLLVVVGGLGGWFAQHQATSNATNQPRIVATTYAVVQIADRLKLPLVGVPTTDNSIPARYRQVTKVGSPMNPSAEKIAATKPTAVYSVTTLKDQFGKSFKQQHITPHFLNLQTVADLQHVVTQMGQRYDRQRAARQANAEIKAAIRTAQQRSHRRSKPRVLVLMGLPGAGYMIGTSKSYVGDLVRLAGGRNVFTSKTQEYIQPNDEAIQNARPQVILRLEHAMPKLVTSQFQQEFKKSIWQQTPAVKSKRVYDLQEPDFDATANMHVARALRRVSDWLYPEE